jgi:Methyltransferase domain
MGVESAADWLGRRAPFVYRVLRRPWRAVLRAARRPAYWDARRHYRYYREAVRLARAHVPEGGAVLDVGAHEAELVAEMDWFARRVALDARYVMPRRGVETVVCDFADYQPDKRFDLVLCLQVLEHVPDPAPFARKLLATGRTAIVSVPYRWPAGELHSHRHDLVDEAKLREWTGAEPIDSALVDDHGRQRLICVYRV